MAPAVREPVLGSVSYTHLDVYKRQAVDPGMENIVADKLDAPIKGVGEKA